MLYPLFFVTVYLSHLRLLRLPYFWDEGGYYIPAAWDFFRTGTLIPQTTITNAHPPLPSILLAAWWHLSGYVVSGTRTLVCMITAAALLGIYRLAKNLTTPAVAAVTVLLTATYPIWFAQSTLAHADIFAAAFTLWALSFYLQPAANSGAPHLGVPGQLAGSGEHLAPEMWDRKPQKKSTKPAIFSNSQMSTQQIRTYCELSSDAERLLERAMQQQGLTARAHDRILKVARTIADLAAEPNISVNHIAEAIQYRTLDRSYWS